ncbi:MAG: response regulator [Lachnospiraceae bacterium]
MKSVVIVDDEYIVVEGIKAMIARNQMDYEVVAAAYDGITGQKMILEYRPDLVITDIRMPGMDGLSLVESIKERVQDTIFIILSGYQEFEYARKALDLGIKGYIDKPITMEKIKQTLTMVETLIQEQTLSKQKTNRESSKKEYQIQSEKMMNLIEEGTVDPKEIQEMGEIQLCHTLNQLQSCFDDITEYRKEGYKLVCLALGIFYEHRSDKREEQHFPSYQNMETMIDYDQVNLFITTIFKSMFQKMELAKLGNMHHIVERVLEYMNENYNKDISLIELADKVALNPAYLSLLFKEEVGTSYIKYLTKLRMDHAKKLLMAGYKVAEVSEMVGYSNYRYFCDIFKKNECLTPNEYKGNVRKGKGIENSAENSPT